jgi:aminoglycoside phosphotransferase (APT) family kinase protein
MRGPVALPRSKAQDILGRVVPEFRVTEVLIRAGGEVSAVYEVRGAGPVRPLIIKVYPERWHSRSDQWRSKLAKEVFVYRLLARHGVRHIPRILHHEPAGDEALPSAYAVMTTLDGRPLAEVGDLLAPADVERVYEQLGRLLAEVHRITADRWGYVAVGLVDSRPSNTAYMLDQFARKLRAYADLGGDPALAEAIDRQVTGHPELLAACAKPSLCHNDFHDGNVLVAHDAKGWRVTGYVDVENAIVADPLLDLARTDYYALRDSDTKRRAFLHGYGQLPRDWAARVTLYRLHHALEFWNWSISTGKPAPLPDLHAELNALMDE